MVKQDEKEEIDVIFWMFLVLSVLFSGGGIVFAAFVTRDSGDGGRGGAIGVAITLAFLFINRDYGLKLYRLVTRDAPELVERAKKRQGLLPTSPPISAAAPDELKKRIDELEQFNGGLTKRADGLEEDINGSVANNPGRR